MTAAFKVVIPVRYASTRLPGKPLLRIGDKPLIRHVYESARASRAAAVIIATDDDRIAEEAGRFGAEVIMTSPSHASGTERIAEAVGRMQAPEESVIVNVQGDEFGLPPALIDQVAQALLSASSRVMATLCEPIEDPETLRDPHTVKVVFAPDGRALYFSRAPIPWNDDETTSCYRHIGIYAYRAGFLARFTALAPCEPERAERLEQLRVLCHGFAIHVEIACERSGIGVDSPADLERARTIQRAR